MEKYVESIADNVINIYNLTTTYASIKRALTKAKVSLKKSTFAFIFL